MCGGRESYQEKTCIRITKAGNAPAPVGVIAMRALLFARNVATVLSEPWASFA